MLAVRDPLLDVDVAEDVPEIEITTYNLDGVEIDTATAYSEGAAALAARTLLEDAVEAGYALADLTVIFKLSGSAPVVFGRDVVTRRAA